MHISLESKPLTALKSGKGKALLCYLAVTGVEHSRSTLSGLLWTDLSEENARANLRKTLSRINPHLGKYLNITRETISFNSDAPYHLDVAELEAIASNASNIHRLQESVTLYKGDFLEGFALIDALLFDEWVQRQRTRLREIAFDGLHTLVDHFMDHKEYDSGITYARQLLGIEPWHEQTHRELMFMLASLGQRSKALKQYEACQRILKEELGIEPSSPTVKLFEKIQQDEIVQDSVDDYGGVGSVKSPLLDNLGKLYVSDIPPLATHLIGRQQELREINEHLLDPKVRLVTIAGLGGIGKTHLALTVARRLEESGEFHDGVFFVPLSSITSHSRLLSAIAESLSLSLTGIRQPEEALIDSLRNCACLLVLDNFDHLLSDVEFLVRVLQFATQMKVLVTSRERLKLREEWVLDLEGLPYPDSIQEAQTSDYDAILLFSDRARQVRSSFSFEKEISGVVRICQLTQGMPLALEQAASLMRIYSANEIADQIEKHLDVLSTTLHNLPKRHRSMHAVLDGSWRWLSKEEQKAFCRLSVFQSGFTREAAEAVVGTNFNILTSLVDKSLIRVDTNYGETTRYTLHDLVRQYAAEKLREAGQAQLEKVQEAFFDFFLSMAERAKQFWDTEKECEWFARLEMERSNLHSALTWAIEKKKAECALQLNTAIWAFLIHNSPAEEAESWLASSLSVEWDEEAYTTMQIRAKVLKFAGYAAIWISNFKLAEIRFQEAAALFSKLEVPNSMTWCWRGSGLVCLIRGDLTGAQYLMQKSWELCQEIQYDYGLAWSAYGLGIVAVARSDLEEANSLLDTAITYFRQHGRKLGIFHTLISLGNLKRAQGKMKKAIACYKEALSIQSDTEYIHYVAQIMEGLAHIAVAEDNMEVAVQLFGIAQARRDKFEMARWAHHEIEYQKSLALTRNQLSESAWQSAWDKGYMMPSQQGLKNAVVVAEAI